MNESEWIGRVAVVTGGASGIGRAVAELILEASGSVVVIDLNTDKLGWTEGYERAIALTGDVTSQETNARMVEIASNQLGGLDAVILNAGLPITGPIDTVPLEDFDRAIDVNLRAVLLGIRAAVPTMKQNGGGSIVVTASVSGLGGDPSMWPYNTAKGGAINLVKAASIDLAQFGIRVNAVCPGPIKTGMTAAMEKVPAIAEALRAHIPLQRWGEATEVAQAISFLASQRASFITGVALPVDGGITAGTGQFLPPQLG
jgi:meso-butanediol dehydrogenase/(S,S)-butanediol dehydrogenase/diacetyl reductase